MTMKKHILSLNQHKHTEATKNKIKETHKEHLYAY